MPQRIVVLAPQNLSVSAKNSIRVIQIGPMGERGPQGIQGPPGAGVTPEDFGVVIPIDVPSTQWVAAHTLSFRPNVTLTDSAGTEFSANEIIHAPNLITINLLSATAGSITLS